VPTTISPNWMTADIQPPYVWTASNGATSYHITVYSFGSSSNVVDDDVSSAACSGGTCTYAPAVTLPLGNYQFEVSASAAATSAFSAWRAFTVGYGQFLPLVLR
jgi:hypothetical protein